MYGNQEMDTKDFFNSVDILMDCLRPGKADGGVSVN